MPSPLEAFRATDRTRFDTDFWRRFLATLVAEVEGVKASKADYDAAVRTLNETGLARINDVLRPAYEEIEDLAHLGALLRASSTSNVGLALGLTEWVIDAAERARFAPAGYLWAVAAPGVAASGQLVSYNRDTGVLRVLVDHVVGTGAHDSWSVAIGQPPDLTHTMRLDNPHGVTAAQVGAYTQAEVDAALAAEASARVAAIASLVNASPAQLDTLNELAVALGNDANFATTMTAALAARLRVDAAQGLTVAQALQARRNLALQHAAPVVYSQAATVIVEADHGKLFTVALAAGNEVLTLPNPANLPNGWRVSARITGTGTGFQTAKAVAAAGSAASPFVLNGAARPAVYFFGGGELLEFVVLDGGYYLNQLQYPAPGIARCYRYWTGTAAWVDVSDATWFEAPLNMWSFNDGNFGLTANRLIMPADGWYRVRSRGYFNNNPISGGTAEVLWSQGLGVSTASPVAWANYNRNRLGANDADTVYNDSLIYCLAGEQVGLYYCGDESSTNACRYCNTYPFLHAELIRR